MNGISPTGGADGLDRPAFPSSRETDSTTAKLIALAEQNFAAAQAERHKQREQAAREEQLQRLADRVHQLLSRWCNLCESGGDMDSLDNIVAEWTEATNALGDRLREGDARSRWVLADHDRTFSHYAASGVFDGDDWSHRRTLYEFARTLVDSLLPSPLTAQQLRPAMERSSLRGTLTFFVTLLDGLTGRLPLYVKTLTEPGKDAAPLSFLDRVRQREEEKKRNAPRREEEQRQRRAEWEQASTEWREGVSGLLTALQPLFSGNNPSPPEIVTALKTVGERITHLDRLERCDPAQHRLRRVGACWAWNDAAGRVARLKAVEEVEADFDRTREMNGGAPAPVLAASLLLTAVEQRVGRLGEHVAYLLAPSWNRSAFGWLPHLLDLLGPQRMSHEPRQSQDFTPAGWAPSQHWLDERRIERLFVGGGLLDEHELEQLFAGFASRSGQPEEWPATMPAETRVLATRGATSRIDLQLSDSALSEAMADIAKARARAMTNTVLEAVYLEPWPPSPLAESDPPRPTVSPSSQQEAINGKGEADSTADLEEDKLSKRQEQILREMCGAKMFTRRVRLKQWQVVEKCQRNANADTWKPYFSKLVKLGYITSEVGPDGGVWLTPKGKAHASTLMS